MARTDGVDVEGATDLLRVSAAGESRRPRRPGNTGHGDKQDGVIPLSTGGAFSIWDGLSVTRYTILTGVDTFPSLPADVKSLMEDAHARKRELKDDGQDRLVPRYVVSRTSPSGPQVARNQGGRSWYAMLSHRFEMYLAVLQSLYLLCAIPGLRLAWARGGRAANLATVTLVIGLYFWAMTIVVSPSCATWCQ